MTTTHVFVVDDDPSARGGLVRLLGKAGHYALGFRSVKEFLVAFDTEASGCLVLDAGLPGLSWDELLVQMETCSKRMPIIMVSAEDDLGARQRGQEIGAVGFFRKPVDGTALLDAIRWALEPNEGK
jgi:two-component system response regulator FixJ